MARVRPRLSSTALTLIAMIAFVVAIVAVGQATSARRGDDPTTGRGGPGTEELNEEAEEQAETVEKRLEAMEAARREGRVGQRRANTAGGPAGWTGEQPFDTDSNDWEPAIAADPNRPWVYAIVTRYGEKPCPGNCPDPFIAIEISSDGGATWSEGAPLCACNGKGQFDPIIEVVPATGHVYALYMKGFNVLFTASRDHGASWSTPVKTYGNVAWTDKPVIAMSDDGRDVYVSFNGPTGGDPWLAQSHDFGATWTQTKLVQSKRYYYAFDADVAADGTVYIGQSSLRYSGPQDTPTGPVEEHVFVSRDRGATWTDRLVASGDVGPACDAEGCSADFYLAHHALTVDATGRVVLLYDRALSAGGPQRIEARSSTNRGRTWSAPVVLSKPGENATSPAAESRGNGDVRAWWMETNGGNDDRWNVWYRRSTDGGGTWSAAVKLSDAGSGADYKTPDGFLEVYGDYGEMAITNRGKTIAIWGEGFSWSGPGGVWFNRER
ncbi:MAG TPA: sialidase family protein [Candidatus Limnocylindrales bacterium]